jgi:hypothetical protein
MRVFVPALRLEESDRARKSSGLSRSVAPNVRAFSPMDVNMSVEARSVTS